MARAKVEAEPYCSFCAKAGTDVAKIISGPGVYICDVCVHKSMQILNDDADPNIATKAFQWEAMSDEDILAHLPRIATVSEQVEGSLAVWINRLRARGVSWARIGESLGMARQSAWERFAQNGD